MSSFLKPGRNLLYFASDLTYPGKVFRFRLGPGTNAPVETAPSTAATIRTISRSRRSA